MSIRFKETFPYRRLAMLVGIFVAIFLSGTAANHALADTSRPVPKDEAQGRVISIYDRGEERTIITKAKTLKQALESAGVEVAIGHDIVEPSLDTELVAAKYNVNIYRARPVTVVDGALRKRVTTAEQTAEGIAKAANIELHKEDDIELEATKDLLMDGAGLAMSIERAELIHFVLYGKASEQRTRAATVSEFLAEKGVSVGDADTLSVNPSNPIEAGMTIELWRDGKQTVTQEEEIDFPIEKIQDANRPVGYKEVKTPGEKGLRNATYEIEMRNGQELNRQEIASVTIKEPKKQVEIVGTKAPVPTNPSENAQLGHKMMLEFGYGEDQWSCLYNLWTRESGWRTTAGNPSSGAYGIPQSLPASKMATYGSDYLTNPATQITWGLNYIKGRYSTPCGAWDHFLSKNWY